MKKLLLAVLGGTAVASLAFASAASLTVDGGVMQVGLDGDLRCDTNGVTVSWVLETDSNLVTGARISDIDADCVGADLFLRTNLISMQQTATISQPGDLKLSIPAQDATALESVRIWIDG